jgi:hypothetical protein
MHNLRLPLVFLLGAVIGLLASSYAFVVRGYKTEYVPPHSDRWYQLVKEGHFPEPMKLSYAEVKSNGAVLEVYGTIENPRDKPAEMQKISADLFDSNDAFMHKCEFWVPQVPPKSKYNFRFHCANISDLKPDGHASSKVYLDF